MLLPLLCLYICCGIHNFWCCVRCVFAIVFKTNTSYQRWDEARKNWGTIVNNSRTIMRQGSAWVHQADISSEEKHRILARLAAAVWSFPRSMARHTLSAREDEADYAADVRSNLRSDLAEDLIAARHKPTRALYEVSSAINEFPLSDWRRIAMDNAVTTLCDAMGSNERLFTSPVPRFYTRHTARFLEVWLLLMPLTLYNAFDYTWNHWAMIVRFWNGSEFVVTMIIYIILTFLTSSFALFFFVFGDSLRQLLSDFSY
jgi:ion channel-forming bestrophin family protein